MDVQNSIFEKREDEKNCENTLKKFDPLVVGQYRKILGKPFRLISVLFLPIVLLCQICYEYLITGKFSYHQHPLIAVIFAAISLMLCVINVADAADLITKSKKCQDLKVGLFLPVVSLFFFGLLCGMLTYYCDLSVPNSLHKYRENEFILNHLFWTVCISFILYIIFDFASRISISFSLKNNKTVGVAYLLTAAFGILLCFASAGYLVLFSIAMSKPSFSSFYIPTPFVQITFGCLIVSVVFNIIFQLKLFGITNELKGTD